MNFVSPRKVMQQVATAVPKKHHHNIIVVGSLAAGFHFFGGDEDREVRTKDIDIVLSPPEEVVISGQAMARELLAHEWKHRSDGDFHGPKSSPTPVEELSAIRLYPPGDRSWFVELLAVPKSEDDTGNKWIPIQLQDGYFGLCSFEFLSLTACKPCETEFAIRYARPEMMALANLLSHPTIGPETMSSLFSGREIKRSNKDLGRALALARLSGVEKLEKWPKQWEEALRECFPTRWRDLAKSAGTGLYELLENEDDLEEALTTCNFGLLARQPLTIEQLRITGNRLVQDAISPLAHLAINS